MKNISLIIFMFIIGTNFLFAQKWLENATKKASNSFSRTTSSISQQRSNLNQKQKKVRTELISQIQSAKTSYSENINKYSIQTLEVTYKLSQKTGNYLVNDYKIAAYEEKSKNLYTNTAMSLLKNFPILDTETNQVVSLDSYTRDIMNDMGASNMEGSDMYDDPLGTVFMMMFDSDYLFEAKLIQDPSTGEWKSISGLSGTSYEEKEVMKNYASLRENYDNNSDPVEFSKSLEHLNESIKKINKEVNYKNKEDSSVGFIFKNIASNEQEAPRDNIDINFHTVFVQPNWQGDWKKKYDPFQFSTITKIYNNHGDLITSFTSTIKSKGGEYIGYRQDISDPKVLKLPIGKYYVKLFSGNDLVYSRSFTVREIKKEVERKGEKDYSIMYLDDFSDVKILDSNKRETDTFKKGDKITFRITLQFMRSPQPNEKIVIPIYFYKSMSRWGKIIDHIVPLGYSSEAYVLEAEVSTFDIPQKGRYKVQVENSDSYFGTHIARSVFIE